LDYCKAEESFPTLIQNRTKKFRNEAAAVTNEGYWFHYLEDKVAAYLLSAELNVSAPEVFCCVTNQADLQECLASPKIPATVDGIVIKATSMHSSQGVYVLVDDPNPSNNATIDLLTGEPMDIADVMSALQFMQATKIIVEEFIGTDLPTEYKFHVMNGEVAAVDIIDGRGTDCPCYAVVDSIMSNRLDRFGCFEPSGMESIDPVSGCTEIDFVTGARRAGPVKKDLNLCDRIPELDDCLWEEMTEIALELGARIGVYMRVDMFVAGGKVYVQEYTTNHMNGLRHCAAKFDTETGCIDSCFMGRMYDAAGGDYGGSTTAVPTKLDKFLTLSAQEQCDLLTDVAAPDRASSCEQATSAPVPGFLGSP